MTKSRFPIKYLILDVDGTLTDGKIYMGPDGEAMKAFNTKDGLGIFGILMPAGITPVIITGRESQMLINRCREIGITEIYQGVRKKLGKMKEIVPDLSEAAYIGDDLNDLACMKAVKDAGGLVGCPADSCKQVQEISDFVSQKAGGDGAVREFIEWLIETLTRSDVNDDSMDVVAQYYMEYLKKKDL